ncbi:N-acetylmuramoyl-L-alanine amidase family protein [Paenibacillus filicis]|uniref:N-acetylmuramoyl-L-alanine amidase family protein n=1 Tax=Paenibacillus gyeongsangnamensis TaxID=3388067 RepID=A0ABT4Q879_9BACL|nr:N-acetylmuramoyl-L-alanine amidase family protein [Paenibacillus filicis]MCZ8512991.1 N-acetylmuramoyl-L-alanine amidase family protein [Paenibacillus filicis]
MKVFTAWMTLLIVSLLCLGGSVSAAASPIELFLNGKPLAAEVAPRIVNQNTIVPVRIIAESLGSKVAWDAKARKVTIDKGTTNIQLWIDKKDATVGSKAYKLETAPTIIDGSTMLPIRFVSEQFGIKVTWDDLTRSVFLFNPDDGNSKQDAAATAGGAGGSVTGTPGGSKTDSLADQPASEIKPGDPVKAGDKTGDGKSGDNTGAPALPPSSPAAGQGTNGGSKNDELPVLQGVTLKDDTLTFRAAGAIAKPNIFYLEGPDRIVVDFPNTKLDPSLLDKVNAQNEGKFPDKNDFVSQIRYSLFSKEPSIVRMVIDLPKKTSFKLGDSSTSPNELSGKLIPVKTRYKVVIDPGHGGKDTGAVSVTKRYEKDFVLALGTKITKLLSQDPNIDVRMTRSDDTFIELADRASFANNLKADLYVSVHANSASKENIGGTETYYYSEQSQPFAELVHKYLLEATGFADRQVKQDRFYVIKNTNMPSILMEVGFLTNRNEDSQMFQDAFQDRVAASIVAAIKKQLNLN